MWRRAGKCAPVGHSNAVSGRGAKRGRAARRFRLREHAHEKGEVLATFTRAGTILAGDGLGRIHFLILELRHNSMELNYGVFANAQVLRCHIHR